MGDFAMVNFLEQLVAEWYEFQGYYVRRNVRVGPLPHGGHAGELDVVAFHPGKKHLVQVEPSMAAQSWDEREKRFAKKFEAGRKYIPDLFAGLHVPRKVDQIALIGFGGAPRGRSAVGGGRLILIRDLMGDIRKTLKGRPIASAAVPEQYVILRSLQYAAHYWS
jgi:hypothetical protein